jgi:hypothetical protein
MLKAVCALTALFLPVFFPVFTLAQTASNPAGSTLNVPGICGLNQRSGYLVVNEAGNLVDLVDYCRQQANQVEQIQRTQQMQQMQQTDPRSALFWQAFEAGASPEAIVVANSLGSDEVFAYGSAICPFLEQGGSLRELRQIQGDGNLPTSFEVAVTVAAIDTYCPRFRSEVGRG